MDLKVVATNRKAYHEYFILETYEAGIELVGSEVKSLREGNANIKEAYVVIRKQQAWAVGININRYSHTGTEGHEPSRNRRLLLNKKEIFKIKASLNQKGQTVVPLKIYFNSGGRAKLEIGLAKGKKMFNKKDAIKEKDIKRDAQRVLREIKR